MDLTLHQLFKIGRRWWWLLALAPIIAGAVAYATSSRQQPLYSASATIEVNPPQTSGSIDYSALQGSKSLAETYRQLITTRKVLEPLITELGLPFGVEELQRKVSASTVGDTRLVRISVSDPDPEAAAEIANAVANRFATYTRERTIELASPYRTALDQQIADVQNQIRDTQRQIRDLESGPNATDPETQDTLFALRATLNQLQQSYRELIVAVNQMDLAAAAAQTQVTVAEEAIPPKSPYAPRTMLHTVLGAFAGLCLAVGAVGLLEYLDNTVKAGLDFTQLIGAPVLSVVGMVPKMTAGRGQLFVLDRPNSTVAESIRLLRTNLEFAAATKEITTLAITSSQPAEGKSTITANLGVALAQRGFTVVIIDADLRRPVQHHIFGVRNEQGLTTLLTHPDLPWQRVVHPVLGPNLSVMTSGPLPPNPSDLLSLDRFSELLKEISLAVDIVLLDTPPVLVVTDPLVVASATDGVVIVSRAGHTRIDALQRTAATLAQGDVRIVGVVLNQQRGRDAEGYYYYYYTQGYYPGDDSTPPGPARTGEGAKPGLDAPSRSPV